MIVSQPALLCLSSLWNNLTGRASDGRSPRRPRAQAGDAACGGNRASGIDSRRAPQAGRSRPRPLDLEPTNRHPGRPRGRKPLRSRRARQLPQSRLPEVASGLGPLTANERRARAAALRALAFSRARRFDAAQTAFQDAATLDPALDLTRVPAFWSLERGAHEAAITAYTGRWQGRGCRCPARQGAERLPAETPAHAQRGGCHLGLERPRACPAFSQRRCQRFQSLAIDRVVLGTAPRRDRHDPGPLQL